MKKRTLIPVLFAALLAGNALSQNTNTLLPFGNVGVGTLFPTAKLQVNGSTLLQGLTVTGTSVFQQNAIFNNQLSVIGNTVLQTTRVLGQLELPSLQLTTSPNEGMQVLLRDPLTGTVTAASIGVFGPLVNPQPLICPTGDIPNPDWVSGTNKLYVLCPQVKVGVGTNNPLQPLHVTGDVLFNSNLQIDQSLTIGNPTTSIPGSVKVFARNGTAVEVRFTDNAATVFKAQNSTGTFTPFLLEANGRMTVHNGTRKIMQLNPDGTLLARTVQIDVVSWPDYVFEESYDLMDLSDLEAYIRLNKHLPNVPSASVAETNGVDLGNMNKVLLEKTEEMTLYIIEQQHQLDSQQKQIDELKAQVQLLLNNK